jgi:flagellar motor switch protein FliG
VPREVREEEIKEKVKEKRVRKLSRVDKVAIILYSMGEETASDVLKMLDHDDVRKISRSMTQMASIPSKAVEETVDEFFKMVSNEEGAIVTIGEDYVKTVITKVLGEKTAERLMESISLQEDGSYIEIFRNLDIKVLGEFVKNEHPQTVALILSQLLPEEASQVLAVLPEQLQLEVVDRLAKFENVSPEMLRDVAHVLEREIKTAQVATKKVGGIKAIAEMLNNMERQKSSELIARIEENDPEMAEEIRQNMFIFEDLVKIDDRGVQEIMKEISTDMDILAKAMKTASEVIKERIYKNMSERAGDMLRENIEDMGPTRISDIEKAQNEIVKVTMKLADEGKIFISGGREEDEYI